jgi:hypothetical protein
MAFDFQCVHFMLHLNNATMLHCNNTMLHCNNTMLHCNNTMLHCNNTMLHCNNTMLQCYTVILQCLARCPAHMLRWTLPGCALSDFSCSAIKHVYSIALSMVDGIKPNQPWTFSFQFVDSWNTEFRQCVHCDLNAIRCVPDFAVRFYDNALHFNIIEHIVL